MTACKDSLSGKKAVSATLAGVLAVGMVPAVALADQAPADDAANDGVELLTADDVAAFNNGAVTEYKVDNGTATATTTTGISINGDGESHTVVPTKVKLAAKNGEKDIVVGVSDTAKYKVTYKAQGSDGKPTGDEIAAPSDAGKYVAIVTAVAGDYKGASCYIGFEIKAVLLSGATAYEVNPEDADDVSDTTFTYTGSELNVGFELNGKPLVEGTDYTVKFVPANGDVYGAAATVKDAGTYNYVLTGLGKYAGQTLGTTGGNARQITVNAFELSNATIETDDVVKGNAAPVHPTKVTAADGKTELDPSLVKLVRSNQTPFGASGNTAYDFTASAADGVNPENGNPNVANVKAVTVNQVGALATFGYDGEAWGDTFKTNLSDKHPVYFSAEWVDVYGTDGKKITDASKYTVKYQKKNGDDSYDDAQALNGALSAAGTYKVTVEVDKTATGYALGGSATCEVVVSEGTVNADANVYVTYGGKVVTSVEKTYDTHEIKASDFTITAKDAKGNAIASDKITATLYDENGKKVPAAGTADAGSYTLKLASEDYELTGTTEIPVTIKKVDLSSLKVNATETWAGADYLPLKADGTAYLWRELDLRYDTGKADSDDNDTATDGEGWDVLSQTPDSLQADAYLKAEKYDEQKGEWVEVSYANGRCKTAGDWRITLTGSKTLAKNYEFANEDYTTTVEFKVYDSKKLVFKDVAPTAWYVDVVADAVTDKLINGYNGTQLFGPNDSITRGQVACVLFNLATAQDKRGDVDYGHYTEGYGWKSFDDVDGTQYYGEAVAWAKNAGVVNGYADGTFKAEQNVTREEFACMLANYAKKVGNFEASDGSALAALPDAGQVSAYATESVAWAVDQKIMGNGGVVNPGAKISRAEAAAMVVNYKNL